MSGKAKNMFKKFIASRFGKMILLTAVVFSMVVIHLGVTPNYSCGCGEAENGTKLTYFINMASKDVIGRKIFETKKPPAGQ